MPFNLSWSRAVRQRTLLDTGIWRVEAQTIAVAGRTRAGALALGREPQLYLPLGGNVQAC